MPFTGDVHEMPFGTFTANGSPTDAVLQHNNAFADTSSSLTILKTAVTPLTAGLTGVTEATLFLNDSVERLFLSQFTSPSALEGSSVYLDYATGDYRRDAQFVDPLLSNFLTCTRAGTALAQNLDGSWSTFAANVLRRTNKGLMVEGAAVAGIRNPSLTGSVSPNTPPTNVTTTPVSGLAMTYSNATTEDGLPCVDFTLAGTALATGTFFLFLEASTIIASVQNDPRILSAFVKLQGGTMAGINTMQLYLGEINSGGGTVASQAGTAFVPTGTRLGNQRYSLAVNVVNAAAASVRPGIIFAVTIGAVVNATFRIALPNVDNTLVISTPMLGSGGGIIRGAEFVTMTSPLQTRGGKIITGMSAANASGNQVFHQWHDGTENNRYRVVRDVNRILRLIVTSAGVETCNLNFGVLDDNANFSLAYTFGFTGFAAVRDGVSYRSQAAGAKPAALTTETFGSGVADSYASGLLTRNGNYILDAARPLLPWTDKQTTKIQWDFVNGRFFETSESDIPMVRATNHVAYDKNGAKKTFGVNALVYPTFVPLTKEPIGAAYWTSSSNYFINSDAPVTQTIALPSAGSWCIWGLSDSGGTLTVTGATSGNGVFTCTPVAEGYLGAGAGLVVNAAAPLSITVTVAGTVAGAYCEINGAPSFPTPPIKTSGVALSRQTDKSLIDTTLYPGRYNLDKGTWAVRFYLHRLNVAGSMFTLHDGTSVNRVSANFKLTPAPQSGVTFTTISGQPAIDPPPNLVVGWNTFAFSMDRSLAIAQVSQNGSIPVSSTGIIMPNPGVLRYVQLGSDFIGGTYSQFLNGGLGNLMHRHDYVSPATLQDLSNGIGW